MFEIAGHFQTYTKTAQVQVILDETTSALASNHIKGSKQAKESSLKLKVGLRRSHFIATSWFSEAVPSIEWKPWG